jgi:hypothetical protein
LLELYWIARREHPELTGSPALCSYRRAPVVARSIAGDTDLLVVSWPLFHFRLIGNRIVEAEEAKF